MQSELYGKVLDFILAVLIMFLVPVLYFGQKNDEVIQGQVDTITFDTVNNTAYNGYFSKNMYEDFIKRLDTTGTVYDINIEVREKILEPEYRFKTADEIIEENNANWKGENKYNYFPVSTSKPIVNEVVNSGNINTETNESVLSKAVNSPADPNHVHTAECFDGHIHSGEKLFNISHAHTGLCRMFTSLTYSTFTCNNYGCSDYGKVQSRFVSSYYWDTTTNSVQLGSFWGGNAECWSCLSTNVNSKGMVYGYGYSCGYDWYEKDDRVSTVEFGRQVPVGEVRTYKMSKPESIKRADYTNGCYTYHNSNYIKDRHYDYYGNLFYGNTRFVLLEILPEYRYSSEGRYWVKNYEGYCALPEYITRTLGREGDSYEFSVTYRVEVNSSGNIVLQYDSWEPTYHFPSLRDKQTFPETLTFEEYRQIIYDDIFNALVTYGGVSPYFLNVNEYDNSGQNLSGEIEVCDHIKANTWIQTCGYPQDGIPTGTITGQYYGSYYMVHPSYRGFYPNGGMKLHLTYYQAPGGRLLVNLSVSKDPNDKEQEYSYLFELPGMNNPLTGTPYLTQISLQIEHVLRNVIDKNYPIYRPGNYTESRVRNAALLVVRQIGRNLPQDTDIIRFKESAYYDKQVFVLHSSGDYVRYLDRNSSNVTTNTPYVPIRKIVGNGTGRYVCHEIITSISPTHKTQAVYLNDDIIRCVTVNYRDGSKKVVLGNTTFRSNQVGDNLKAILTLVGKDTIHTTKTFTAEVTVKVVLKTKVCIHNHTYRMNGDGTDPGCPYCKSWLSSLTIYQPASRTLSIYKGTGLEENGVIVLATYLDGRKEYLTNQYVHNLDKNYVGIQTVTVSYKGEYNTLQVTVKKNIKQCAICGRYYELHPDNSDPGCPYCASLIPVFTGNILEYYNIVSKNEILTQLYDGTGKVLLREGDYIKIALKNKTKTTSMNLLRMLYGNSHDVITSHGMKIRDTGT